MKTKIILWILAIMMVMPAPSHAQNDNSKKSNKKTEKAVAIAGGALVGAAVLGSLFKKKDKQETEMTEVQEASFVAESTETVGEDIVANEEGVEVAVVGEELQRREGAFKLITNHPDFKIKVRRCEVSGKTCVIDLILENVGSSDVTIRVQSSHGHDDLIAYDDEANEYKFIKLSVGSKWIPTAYSESTTLLAGVPVKARIQIEGVAESATMLRRLDWRITSNAWGLDRNKPIKFINLPISREGDE